MFDKDVLAMPGAKLALALLAVCSLATALLACGQALNLAEALAAVWDGADAASQAPALAIFLGCLIARKILDVVRDRSMERFARDRCRELRRDFAASLYDSGAGKARAVGTGSAVDAMVEGVDRIENYIALIVPKVAAVMVEPIVLLVALALLDPVTAIVSVVVLPFIGLYMVLLGRNAREAAERRHGEYTVLANHFVDSLRGMSTLRAFGRTAGRSEEVFATSEQFRVATVQTLRVATLSSLALDLFATFALAAASILLGFRLMAGWVDLAAALAALMLVPEFFSPIIRFGKDFHATLDGKNALAALRAVICDEQAADRETRDGSTSLPDDVPPTGTSVHELASMQDVASIRLLLDDVWYRYPFAGTSEEDDARHSDDRASQEPGFALNGINFDVQGATKVGIVGLSGAGKSTLATMLAGQIQPSSGSMEARWLDGTPGGRSCTSREWLDHVCYIPQNPYVFHATLRDNIAFYKPGATDAQIADALAAAGLGDFAAGLPDGLDTVVGEGGRGLSGGQAQRIALARAFLDGGLRRALVFDEPTAHLDIETEYALKEHMLALMEGRLVFFSTHRLHWMRDMDRILVLDKGRLVEDGSYDELLARDGAFARLVSELRGGEDL